MEIRRWHCYIAINCAVIIPCIVAKSISLNEIIAAENQKKQAFENTSESKLRETRENFTAPKTTPTKLPWIKSRKLKAKYIPLDKKISLLKYTKAFKIKSPLRSSKLNHKLRNKLRNQSSKREIGHNENIKRKYTPLLRNLGVLFDNLLSTDDGGSIEIFNERRYKQNKSDSKRSGMVCTCTHKSGHERSPSKSQKKTISATTPFPTEVSNAPKIATKTATNTTVANVSSIRPHKDIPLLFSRNTSSGRRNYNGHSERSSPTFYGSVKRNISGNNGNSEYLTRIRENESRTESDEENTYCDSRDDASGTGFRRGNRNNTRDTSLSRITTNEDIKQSKGKNNIKGTVTLQRKVKYYARGNETESRVSIPKYDRGSRRVTTKNKVSPDTESIQSKEDHEESYDRFTYNHTNNKRIVGGSSPFATENQNVTTELETVTPIQNVSSLILASQNPSITTDQNITEKLETVIPIKDLLNLTLDSQNQSTFTKDQKFTEELETVPIQDLSNLTLAFQSPSTLTTDENITEELETVISIKDLSNLTLALQGPPKGKVPVVTIFGGYSVARDINGQNKLSEQSIVIHS